MILRGLDALVKLVETAAQAAKTTTLPLPVSIEVVQKLTREESLKLAQYLLKIEGKLLEAMSEKPLEIGKQYWAQAQKSSDGALKLSELVQKPSILQQTQELPAQSIELKKLVELVKTFVEEKKPSSQVEPPAKKSEEPKTDTAKTGSPREQGKETQPPQEQKAAQPPQSEPQKNIPLSKLQEPQIFTKEPPPSHTPPKVSTDTRADTQKPSDQRSAEKESAGVEKTSSQQKPPTATTRTDQPQSERPQPTQQPAVAETQKSAPLSKLITPQVQAQAQPSQEPPKLPTTADIEHPPKPKSQTVQKILADVVIKTPIPQEQSAQPPKSIEIPKAQDGQTARPTLHEPQPQTQNTQTKAALEEPPKKPDAQPQQQSTATQQNRPSSDAARALWVHRLLEQERPKQQSASAATPTQQTLQSKSAQEPPEQKPQPQTAKTTSEQPMGQQKEPTKELLASLAHTAIGETALFTMPQALQQPAATQQETLLQLILDLATQQPQGEEQADSTTSKPVQEQEQKERGVNESPQQLPQNAQNMQEAKAQPTIEAEKIGQRPQEPIEPQTQQPQKEQESPRTPASAIKAALLNELANAQTKEQFSTLATVALAMSRQVVTLGAQGKDGSSGVVQFRRKKPNFNTQTVEFYSAFEQLGPVGGEVTLAGDEIYLSLLVQFESSFKLLQSELQHIEFFDQKNILVRHETPQVISWEPTLFSVHA